MGREIVMSLRIGPTTSKELVEILGTMAQLETEQKEMRDASRTT
tara:strand:- start:938 stop:1069 length:132 start_codon:yes stop_codon:yes gene_type:complete